MSFDAYIQAIPIAASSPYALLAYVVIVVSNVIIALKVIRLKWVLKDIEKIPEKDRRGILERLIGVVLPDQISAEEWIRSNVHRYIFFSFIALLVFIVVALGIIYREAKILEGWKDEAAIAALENGLDRGYLHSVLGPPKRSSERSEDFGLTTPVVYDWYFDAERELQLLYKDDVLLGYVLRNLDGEEFSRKIWTGVKSWVLGESRFDEVGEDAQSVDERLHFRTSICRVEKYYFGAAAGSQDYYLSKRMTSGSQELSATEKPTALLVVNTDSFCEEDDEREASEECVAMLKGLVCTYGDDF
ncbi:hypothetical protein [Pseudomonas vranovensis]|uniref:Uncharacterized protein n=1 Tax=Pseudomonas vranovensis TaxID=321661 RepID=A0A423DU54_9PSED|nr:hypothetical protein [Pseudomonas vranovensis]ROL75571.1 hypothetical protein BHU25_09220 [Pseudomonas vranovensis]